MKIRAAFPRAAVILMSMAAMVCSGCFSEGGMGNATGEESAAFQDVPPYLVGAKAGEVTAESAVIQDYLLEKSPEDLLQQPYTERRYLGAPGWAAIEYSTSPLAPSASAPISAEDFRSYQAQQTESAFTDWQRIPGHSIAEGDPAGLEAGELRRAGETDFSFHQRLNALRPATEYHFRTWVRGAEAGMVRAGTAHRLRTAPAAEALTDVSFIAATCFNHSVMRDLRDGTWPVRGFRMHKAIQNLVEAKQLAFDFAVFNGDTVYLDKQVPRYRPRVEYTTEGLRTRYLDSYGTPLARQFFEQVPTYFQKDDHDWRFNDADPVFDPRKKPPAAYAALTKHYRGPPGPLLGKQVFEEMHPLDGAGAPYRTFRWGRGLQIWILESRECRYPNDRALGAYQIEGLAVGENASQHLRYPEYCGMPSAEELWGPKQFAWLLDTLKASDAYFKVVISPTPVLGPDQSLYLQLAMRPVDRKADNHVRRYRKELGRFLDALRQEGLKNVYFVSGDRHFIWHSRYTAADGQTLEELGTGPFADDIVPRGDIFYRDERGKAALVGSLARAGFVHVQIRNVAEQPRLRVEWYAMMDWATARVQKWSHTFEAELVR